MQQQSDVGHTLMAAGTDTAMLAPGAVPPLAQEPPTTSTSAFPRRCWQQATGCCISGRVLRWEAQNTPQVTSHFEDRTADRVRMRSPITLGTRG